MSLGAQCNGDALRLNTDKNSYRSEYLLICWGFACLVIQILDARPDFRVLIQSWVLYTLMAAGSQAICMPLGPGIGYCLVFFVFSKGEGG